MKIKELTANQLRQALEIKERIETLETDLRRVLAPAQIKNGTERETAAEIEQPKPKRPMSIAARRKLSMIAKKRWAVRRQQAV